MHDVPNPDRAKPRSPRANPESGHGLLRQARLSPDQHARYQRRGGHQCRPHLSLFREQGGGHFGDGGSTQKRNSRGDGTRAAGAHVARIAWRFCSRPIAAKTRRRCNRPSWSIFTRRRRATRKWPILVRDVLQTAMDGVTDLIARSPEAEIAAHGLTPNELAELIFAVARGMLMRDVLQPQEMTAAERRARQLEVTRKTLAAVV